MNVFSSMCLPRESILRYIHSFIHSQFISVNLVYKDMENVMFIILGVTKHIYKENNNYKQ